MAKEFSHNHGQPRNLQQYYSNKKKNSIKQNTHTCIYKYKETENIMLNVKKKCGEREGVGGVRQETRESFYCQSYLWMDCHINIVVIDFLNDLS